MSNVDLHEMQAVNLMHSSQRTTLSVTDIRLAPGSNSPANLNIIVNFLQASSLHQHFSFHKVPLSSFFLPCNSPFLFPSGLMDTRLGLHRGRWTNGRVAFISAILSAAKCLSEASCSVGLSKVTSRGFYHQVDLNQTAYKVPLGKETTLQFISTVQDQCTYC
ncbi:unnamed protein product [Leuciscus chuanchicus]